MRGKSNFTDLSERYLFLLTDVLLVAQVGRTGMGGWDRDGWRCVVKWLASTSAV